MLPNDMVLPLQSRPRYTNRINTDSLAIRQNPDICLRDDVSRIENMYLKQEQSSQKPVGERISLFDRILTCPSTSAKSRRSTDHRETGG